MFNDNNETTLLPIIINDNNDINIWIYNVCNNNDDHDIIMANGSHYSI